METTIFGVMGQMVTNSITWMGELLEFVIGQPYVLVPMLLFFVAKLHLACYMVTYSKNLEYAGKP